MTGAGNQAGEVVIEATIDNGEVNVDVSDSETVALTVSAGSADAGTSSIGADRTSGRDGGRHRCINSYDNGSGCSR